MKSAYRIFIIIILIFTAIYTIQMDRRLINTELQENPVVIEAHRLVYSRWFSMVSCNGLDLKSFGYPTTGLPCTSTAYCRENWPEGISYEVRDTKAVCCMDTHSDGYGQCGQWMEAIA